MPKVNLFWSINVVRVLCQYLCKYHCLCLLIIYANNAVGFLKIYIIYAKYSVVLVELLFMPNIQLFLVQLLFKPNITVNIIDLHHNLVIFLRFVNYFIYWKTIFIILPFYLAIPLKALYISFLHTRAQDFF